MNSFLKNLFQSQQDFKSGKADGLQAQLIILGGSKSTVFTSKQPWRVKMGTLVNVHEQPKIISCSLSCVRSTLNKL